MTPTRSKKRLLSVVAVWGLAAGTVIASGNAFADDDPAPGEPGDVGTTIVGGAPVTENQPWIAALSGDNGFTCTSSQVDAEWIITAAHCVENGGSFTVRIGSLDRTSGGVVRAVDEVNIHPDYNWPENDIALLHLSEGFANGYAPMADTRDVLLGQDATIYGWGSENSDWSGPLPEHLKYADGVTSAQDCDTAGVVCVVGNGGVAGGDSGGPAFVRSPVTGEFVQVGVCAIGYRPTDGTWSGYTSIPDHAEWITTILG